MTTPTPSPDLAPTPSLASPATAAPAAPDTDRASAQIPRSEPLQEQAIVVFLGVASMPPASPVKLADRDTLIKADHVYRRIAGGLATALRPHGLLVGRAGRAFAIVGRRPRRRVSVDDRARIAAWCARSSDTLRVQISWPLDLAGLEHHLLAVHGEGLPVFPSHDFGSSRAIAPFVTMQQPLHDRLREAERTFASGADADIPDEVMLSAVIYTGQIERLATQAALALRDARRQRGGARRGAR